MRGRMRGGRLSSALCLQQPTGTLLGRSAWGMRKPCRSSAPAATFLLFDATSQAPLQARHAYLRNQQLTPVSSSKFPTIAYGEEAGA